MIVYSKFMYVSFIPKVEVVCASLGIVEARLLGSVPRRCSADLALLFVASIRGCIVVRGFGFWIQENVPNVVWFSGFRHFGYVVWGFRGSELGLEEATGTGAAAANACYS